MRKNDVSLLIALIALTISGCNSTSKKKPKKASSTVESSSVLSSSKQGTSNTSSPTSNVGPSSEVISSASTPEQSSETPVSSAYPSSSVPYVSSAQPTQSSQTPTPSSSGGWQSSATPSASSSIPQSSSSIPSTSIPPIVDEYYSSINSSDSGDTLKLKLKGIIKSGHTKIAYSNLADIMAYTDRDWNKSPNENDSNPYMHLLYLVDNENNPYRHSAYPNTWDKEHIWAKSNGFPNDSNSNFAYSDLHHLRASDKLNNGNRGHLCMNDVTSGNYVKDANGDNSGYKSDSCYMPQACDRGDVARALFYMATRYCLGDDCESSLYLSFENNNNSSGGWWGHLDVLLRWHQEDPVDEFERHRNDLVYTYQHNRNPFIDYPEFAQRIWQQ